MEYSTLKPWQEVGETGVIYDIDSLYGRFQHICDPRGAKGKRYSMVMLLVVILLAKLVGKDKPEELADWAKNHAGELAKLLKLPRMWMPSHSTIRRVYHTILDEAEFDRLAQEYQQQEQSAEGEVLAMDGKTLRGTRMAGQERGEHILSIYEAQGQCVLAQQAVGRQENEIVAAARALEQVSLAGKIVTGDAMHAQTAASQQIVTRGGDYPGRSKRTSRVCTQIFSACLLQTSPNPVLVKSRRISSPPTRPITGMDGWKNAPSRPVPC